MAIAAATGNDVMIDFLKSIREALEELIVKSLLLPAGTDMAYKQHRALLDVMKQRNAGKARNAMRAHLLSFQRGYRVLFRASN
jgi:DNA-binding FadR family transcriptional regulator